LAQRYSQSERRSLFAETAVQAYRLERFARVSRSDTPPGTL
jgi:hypothetical protein